MQHRLYNYCADCAVRFKELTPDELAERALRAMHDPVSYKAVETDGAARAARKIGGESSRGRVHHFDAIQCRTCRRGLNPDK